MAVVAGKDAGHPGAGPDTQAHNKLEKLQEDELVLSLSLTQQRAHCQHRLSEVQAANERLREHISRVGQGVYRPAPLTALRPAESGVPQGGGKEHRSLSAAELADELQRLQSEQAAAAAMQLQQQDEARVLATGLVMQLQAEKNAYHQATSESTAALHVKQEELRDVLQAEHLAQTELDQLLALRRAREARIAEAAAAYEVWKRRDAAAWLIQRLYKRHIRRRAVYMMKGKKNIKNAAKDSDKGAPPTADGKAAPAAAKKADAKAAPSPVKKADSKPASASPKKGAK